MSSFDQLALSKKEEFFSAFSLLSTTTQPIEKSSADHSAVVAAPVPVVRVDALVNLLRVLNLTIPEDALLSVIQKVRGPDHHSANAGFTAEQVRDIFDVLAPMQPANVTAYMQFFNLLDVHETGSIPVADLKHALCNIGDKLSLDEFHHLLYKNDLLQKERITVFEFLRLLLRVQRDGQPQ